MNLNLYIFICIYKQFGCVRESLLTKSLVPISNGVFIIDLDKRVRMSSRYSPTVGRNFYEILRAYDALNLTTNHKVVCPANWGNGQDVFLNTALPTEELSGYRYAEIKPWLKLSPMPEN